MSTGPEDGYPEHGKSYVYCLSRVLPSPLGYVVQMDGSCLYIDARIAVLEVQLRSYIRHFWQSDDLHNKNAINDQNPKYIFSALYLSI